MGLSGELDIDLQLREPRVHGTATPIASRAFDIIEVLAQAGVAPSSHGTELFVPRSTGAMNG
jgi:hypothetical protein